jgi:sugar phosphate permease
VTFVVSGLAVRYLDWRYALFIPAAMLTATAVFMLLFLKEAPDEKSQPALGGQDSASHKEKRSWSENLILTLSNPALWLLGLALGLLNATRYGFLDWGIDHLTDMQDASISKNAIKYAVLPIGAVGGSYLAGWATDRWFGSRRAPVIVALLFLLGVLTLLYERVTQVSTTGTLFLLVIIGFCIYGPQVLLVGTAPSDLARRGTSAAAAGFVNFMGYMGAAAGDIVTGYFKMPEHGGWRLTIYIWAGWAFAASLLMALLWNVTGKNSDPSSD